MILRLTVLLSITGLLCGCLPGEDDVAKRYNDINQRAHIQNTGNSLMQAAHNMVGYMTADSMKLKAPLDQVPITDLGTAENNVVPKDPPGVKVVTCDTNMFGAAAYFTEQPKGVPPLSLVGETMRASLTKRFGGQSVGWHSKGESIMPPLWTDAGCDSNLEGIADYSPIFVAGFVYNGDEHGRMVLPDPALATQPEIKREVTLPCPGGYHGVIMRPQSCKLKSGESDEVEEVTFVTNVHQRGGETQSAGHELQAVRKKKIWDCYPAVGANLTATAEEIAHFCRDPSQDMTKPDDNLTIVHLDNIKEYLESNKTRNEYYEVACRESADGSNSCHTTPYTPVIPDTFLRCDSANSPERYVINPKLPVEVNEAGNVVTATPEAANTGAIVGNHECGHGWTGDLIAGYKARACQLIKRENGVETPIKLAQTIYQIGYVGARCKTPPLESTYNCPWPLGGQMILREEHQMTKPLALQLQTAARGEWANSFIPYSANVNAETQERASNQNYIISNVNLTGLTNPDFTSYLQGAMGTDMQKDITGCKLAGQTCEFLPDPIRLGIVFDRSGSMDSGSLNSSSQRMECKAKIRDIFSNPLAACFLLELGIRNINYYERFLGDRSNPIVRNLLEDAIANRRNCNDMTIDKVGYCTPGRGQNQSTCNPGTCQTVTSDLVKAKRLAVAEEQLLTALGYIPPGSQLRYTEYLNNNVSFIPFPKFCDPMEDDTCDFGTEIESAKNRIIANKNQHAGDTPLLRAISTALEQFGNLTTGSEEKGIIILFTDGGATDNDYWERNSFPYPYADICQDNIPTSYPDGGYDALCRYVGYTENGITDEKKDYVTATLHSLYISNTCAENKFPSADAENQYSTVACRNIDAIYNPDTAKLRENNLCESVGVNSRSALTNYMRDKFPNVKLFILDMDNAFRSCPSDIDGQVVKISINDPTAFSIAFETAFSSLNTRSATPEYVCQRLRERIYPHALNY
jgi:hypothetical protein